MLNLFAHFFIGLIIFFPITLLLITLARNYNEDKDPTHIGTLFVLVLLGLLTCTSCTKEEFLPPLCDLGCNAEFFIDLPQDNNGFYLVDGDRFSIEVYASPTNRYYWYNDAPFIEAKFTGDRVQQASIYFREINGEYFTKRIVGPITNEMVGDTLYIQGKIHWDGGNEWEIKKYDLKFIVI